VNLEQAHHQAIHGGGNWKLGSAPSGPTTRCSSHSCPTRKSEPPLLLQESATSGETGAERALRTRQATALRKRHVAEGDGALVLLLPPRSFHQSACCRGDGRRPRPLVGNGG
jgi:hypothetical protein